MQFTIERRKVNPYLWHPWFAWYPVYVESQGQRTEDCWQYWVERYAWLEWVERKGKFNRDYRFIKHG